MSIEQHPIPQDVAGYKFRLIGEMTVKQFIWLAGGIILGLITYSTPLPFFFKYPLTGILVFLGAGIAFIPVEGRPMDKWLIAFIKSVYSPTQLTWQKGVSLQTPTQSTMAAAKPPPAPNPPVQATAPVAPPKPVPPTPIPVAPKPVAPPQTAPAPSGGNLPIPFTPITPNTLVGMTLTPEGKILDGCLIEIKNNDISLRATKSNQLGQFLFAKPLENGNYQIFTEKPGFVFDSYSLNLTGQIVKPLRLQSTKANV